MELKRIGLSGIVIIHAIFFGLTCAAVSSAKECPPGYVDCGDLSRYCCFDERFCVIPDSTHCILVAETIETCPSSIIYGEHSDETQLLRSLRDNVLNKTHEGRELIKLYYQWSPLIVKAMEADEDFKEDVKKMVDGVLKMIEEAVE